MNALTERRRSWKVAGERERRSEALTTPTIWLFTSTGTAEVEDSYILA